MSRPPAHGTQSRFFCKVYSTGHTDEILSSYEITGNHIDQLANVQSRAELIRNARRNLSQLSTLGPPARYTKLPAKSSAAMRALSMNQVRHQD